MVALTVEGVKCPYCCGSVWQVEIYNCNCRYWVEEHDDELCERGQKNV